VDTTLPLAGALGPDVPAQLVDGSLAFLKGTIIAAMEVQMTWPYYPWRLPGDPPVDSPIRLRHKNVLITAPSDPGALTSLDMIVHADISYLSCRILMLSSRVVHPAALYMAGQTIEKYLKAILLASGRDAPRHHRLVKLANCVGAPFDDEEFLELCRHLEPFNVAGRYPDHPLYAWRYSLNLLAFLDAFVVKCRQIAQMPPDASNVIAQLGRQDCGDNPVMAAAVIALQDQNRHLLELTQQQ